MPKTHPLSNAIIQITVNNFLVEPRICIWHNLSYSKYVRVLWVHFQRQAQPHRDTKVVARVYIQTDNSRAIIWITRSLQNARASRLYTYIWTKTRNTPKINAISACVIQGFPITILCSNPRYSFTSKTTKFLYNIYTFCNYIGRVVLLFLMPHKHRAFLIWGGMDGVALSSWKALSEILVNRHIRLAYWTLHTLCVMPSTLWKHKISVASMTSNVRIWKFSGEFLVSF